MAWKNEEVYCTQCGTLASTENKLCTKCGSPVGEATPERTTLSTRSSKTYVLPPEDIEKCKKYFRTSLFSVSVFYGSFLLMFILAGTEITGFMRYVIVLNSLGWFISLLIYYWSLGVLAVTNNRSVIIWIGLTLLTSPIGPCIAFFLMRNIGIKNGWV